MTKQVADTKKDEPSIDSGRRRQVASLPLLKIPGAAARANSIDQASESHKRGLSRGTSSNYQGRRETGDS